MKYVYIIFLIFVSCSNTPRNNPLLVDGIWEIESVYNQENLLKSYKISTSLDLFKIISDSAGYRKKLSPIFDGSYQASENRKDFKISNFENTILLTYGEGENTIVEELIKVTPNKLVLRNKNKFDFHYKKYEPIKIE
jgi:hypothetical protein